MKLMKLKLRNFRCFGSSITTIDFDETTVLVGGNSTGKTAVMAALAKLFAVESKGRQLDRSDFHVPKGSTPGSLQNSNLMIEAVFSFPELQSGSSEARTLATYTVPQVFGQMKVLSDGQAIVRVRLTATWSRGTTPEGDIDSALEFIVAPEGAEEGPDVKKKVLNQHRSHIQFLYVPAIRDPSNQVRVQAGAMLKRLFDAIQWSDELPEAVQVQADETHNLFAKEPGYLSVQSILATQWKQFQQDYRFREVQIGFATADLVDLLKTAEIRFMPTLDGRPYTAEQLGDGLRSMFYLSLVTAVLELEGQVMTDPEVAERGLKDYADRLPALTIIGVEEPENHLSPQMLGKVMANLFKTAGQPNAALVMSSHSPSILKRITPSQIRHLRVDHGDGSVIVNKITLPPEEDEAHKFVKEAVQAHPELYFSRFVILGEGDSEEYVLPAVLSAFGCDLDRDELAVVPLGGRHVNHFWKLLSQLAIPHITLLDFDQERRGGDWGRVAYVIEQLSAIGVPVLDPIKWQIDDKCYSLPRKDLEPLIKNRDLSKPEPMTGVLLHLRSRGVFFSTPLDLDFMMLQHYTEHYKATVAGNEGPRIPAAGLELDEYLKGAKRAVLKEQSGDGRSLGCNEELYPWYRYLFLGKRGKPVTHKIVLATLTEKQLADSLPEPLDALAQYINTHLGRS